MPLNRLLCAPLSLALSPLNRGEREPEAQGAIPPFGFLPSFTENRGTKNKWRKPAPNVAGIVK